MHPACRGLWAAGLLTAFFALPAFAQEACIACHGPGGNSLQPNVPSLAGQPKLFIENQLVLMREELRPAPQMQAIVKGMKDAEISRLAGQREAYLEAEMRAYRDNKRKGGDTVMAEALYGVPDNDIKALAHYLSRSNAPAPAR